MSALPSTLKTNDGPAKSTPGRRRARPSSAKTRHQQTKPVKAPGRLIDSPGPEAGEAPEDQILTVGVVIGTHGLNGELKVRVVSDDVEHVLTLTQVIIGDGDAPRHITGARLHAGHLLLSIRGISTPEAASALTGQPVRVPARELRPLAPGEYFIYQLVGLAVVTEAGEPLGTVTDLIETGANDVLMIAPPDGGPDLLLPLISSVVLDIDPAAGRIIARPLDYYESS
jgi:16S rRNA processing protein RimM